jgi:CDP-glycerol glycerophosphotransferase
MKHATGEYISFIDSDDWISFNFYKHLYDLALKYDADISGSDVVSWYSPHKIKESWSSYWTYKSKKTIITDIEDKKNLIFACSCWYKIYRRKFIEANNIVFPPHKFIEDFPFTFASTIMANKIVLDYPNNEAVYFYRQRDTSIMHSAKHNAAVAFDALDNHRLLFKILDTLNISKKDKKHFSQIAEVFAIENLFNWLNVLPNENKEEFFQKYKDLIGGFDINKNVYAGIYAKIISKLLDISVSHTDLIFVLLRVPIKAYEICKRRFLKIKKFCFNKDIVI